MKKYSLLSISILLFGLLSCVQKSGKKTIIVKLNVEGIENIQSVGMRGSEKPLSWDYDLELKPIIKDKIYTTSFSLITGYKFTEAKFTVNGQFELNDKNNRRIVFSNTDTTVYEATYNVEKK